MGVSYICGRGIGINKDQAKYYWELAAINGNTRARCDLGKLEIHNGTNEQAKKHIMIAARAGDNESLDSVKAGFMEGNVTKDEYENVLRSYHKRQLEMKSDARDKYQALHDKAYGLRL